MDREKVIKGLECCMKFTGEPNTATCHCSDCSYTNMDIFGQRCLIDLINDALALLKQQEAKTGHWTTKRNNLHDGEWYCDQCDYEPTVFEGMPYCASCGAKMEIGR